MGSDSALLVPADAAVVWMRVVECFGRGRNKLRQGHEKDHHHVRVTGQHLELAMGSVSELMVTKQGRETPTTYCSTSH
jgi:hypothetical protein